MKKAIFLIVTLFCIFFTSKTSAHFGGVSALKVNNSPTKVYTQEEYAMVGPEIIPSDIAPGKYLVNKPIRFEVDESKLPVPDEILEKSSYQWDLGDGSKAKGEEITHSFKKIGSYVVTLEINYNLPKELEEQGIFLNQQYQTLLLHILPNEEYKIPNSKIYIDSQEIKNPIKDRPRFKFFNQFWFIRLPKSFTFDVSKSQGSSRIKSVLWDFGDGETSKKSKVRYRFKDKSYFYTIGLKITDENNFSSYSVINMANKEAFE